MIAESITIPGRDDLYARLWTRGADPASGVIILLHGLGDHSGRYSSFAKRLVNRGMAVFAFDLPGHGRSAGRRGSAKSYDSILKAVGSCRQLLTDRLGPVDQYIIGHSMGGNLAVNYALRRQEFDRVDTQELSGIVLAAPMLMPPEFLDRQKVFAAWATGQMFRWIRLSKPARPEQLSRDPEHAELRKADPLRHSQISLYLATQLLAQGRFALDHARDIDVPALVIVGDEDELIDGVAAHNLALRMGPSGEFLSWPKGRHDLLNDVDAEEMSERLLDWIARNSGAARPKLRLANPVGTYDIHPATGVEGEERVFGEGERSLK